MDKILKLLGTEYSMQLRFNPNIMGHEVTISDLEDNHSRYAFSNLEAEVAGCDLLLCVIEQCISSIAELKTVKSNRANWLFWPGWSGNHDRRIEDAKCSKCGYVHHTVYGSLDKLSKHCPDCGSKMKAN